MSARHHYKHLQPEIIRKIINNPERDLPKIAREAVRVSSLERLLSAERRENDDLPRRRSVSLDDRMAARPESRLAQLRGESSKRVFDKRVAPAQDRRRYNPESVKYTWHFEPIVTPHPSTVFGTKAQVEPAAGGRFGFRTPLLVDLCIKRKSRREVLFALHRNGGGHKKPRRGPHSDIGC